MHSFRQTIAVLTILALIGLTNSTRAYEGPTVTSLFPAGGSLGTTVDVQASGSFPSWPASVWTEREGVKWTALEKPGQFRVEITSDATPGPCRVRFFDSKGANTSRIWWIGWSQEALETEPNDGHKQPQKIEHLPTVINAVLAKSGDYDTFLIDCEQGQTVVASVMSNRWIRSPVDSSLQILDNRGNVLAQNLDYDGLDPFLVWNAPRTGSYLIRVFGFPEAPDGTIAVAGSESYVYRLAITTGPYLRSTRPLALSKNAPSKLEIVGLNLDSIASRELFIAPNQVHTQSLDPERSQTIFTKDSLGFQVLPIIDHPLQIESTESHELNQVDKPVLQPPVTITGSLETSREVDRYRLQVPENSRWKFTLESRSIGFQADAVLRLLEASGKELQRVDDAQESVDPQFAWQSTAAGIVELEVSDLFGKGGEGFDYRLSVTAEKPHAKLSIPSEVIQGVVGTPIEIPIQVERILEFGGDLAIELVGAGEGVSADTVTSQAGNDSAKQCKLIVRASSPIQGPIQIVARNTSLPDGISVAKANDSRTSWLWLSVASP